MRQQLIEALTYPRLLIKKLIEEHNYQHDNMFEATGERCHHCTGEDCGWETCFQDFRKFEEMPIETLAASLREGTPPAARRAGDASPGELTRKGQRSLPLFHWARPPRSRIGVRLGL